MDFVNKHITKILGGFALLFLLTIVQNCSQSRRLRNIERNQKVEISMLDTLATKADVTNLTKTIQLSLKIEGLKAEKRMIQATDRKMMDLNRQTSIDEELKKLEPQLKWTRKQHITL